MEDILVARQSSGSSQNWSDYDSVDCAIADMYIRWPGSEVKILLHDKDKRGLKSWEVVIKGKIQKTSERLVKEVKKPKRGGTQANRALKNWDTRRI